MLFLSLLGLLSIQVLASSIALRPRDGGLKPFAFTPSLTWDGNDGTWSTFIVRVGTPPQSFRVLPSTAARELVIPLVDGCIRSDPPNCGDLRGAYPFDNKASSGFLVNKSSTWDNNRLYELVLDKELNLTNNALYGFDSVGLQVDQSGGLELDHQIVAGIATKDFYLGLFGLAPEPTNFSTTFSEPKQSFMVTLKEAKKIPSLSYGYTAGAKYSNKGVLGSLTLGGYDTSRFTPNNISFTFGVEDTRLILVGIQSITAANTLDGMRTLLTDGIFSLIDTSLPYIWLPEAACNNFQTAFGLTYDPKTQLYLVNDTIHAKLKEAQPSITFKLGNKLLGGEYINIALPYSAFDLQAKHPIYPNTTNYFPIRKAANDTQYVIGRSFFQEAYLIVDYEQRNFSISQAILQDSYNKNIVPIASANALPPLSKIPPASSSPRVSAGIIAAVVISCVVVLVGVIVLVWCVRTRRRVSSERAEPLAKADRFSTSFGETDMKPWPTYYEADSNQTAHEIPEPGRWAGKHEVSGRPIWKPQEMQGSGPHASELGDTRAGRHQIAPYEMLGDSAWNAGHR